MKIEDVLHTFQKQEQGKQQRDTQEGTLLTLPQLHPPKPATKKPINATVITTGPGVIIATATASMNCFSESQ